MNHFTDRRGWKAIRSQSPWRFKAHKQRHRERPFGAYFTPLHPQEAKFFKRTRVPVKKQQYLFMFVDFGDLTPIDGPFGKHVLYSPDDYLVHTARQVYEGTT